MSDSSLNLTGHFLIAMPTTSSDLFDGSLIYVFDHSEDGAVGLIVNQPSTIPFAELLGDLSAIGDNEEEIENNIADTLVYFGGPINSDKGFVLHSADKTYRSTIGNNGLLMTSSRDVLLDHARGQGPKHFMLALGYAGWGPGQLEDELAANAWLTVKATPEVIFNCPIVERYHRAISLLGFDPEVLLGEAGNA
ncbi:MAG: YqgE/AlgH family protein [Pelistega sp.]|nr:YqgE/AlgH family protein [Pelistega sp.]